MPNGEIRTDGERARQRLESTFGCHKAPKLEFSANGSNTNSVIPIQRGAISTSQTLRLAAATVTLGLATLRQIPRNTAARKGVCTSCGSLHAIHQGDRARREDSTRLSCCDLRALPVRANLDSTETVASAAPVGTRVVKKTCPARDTNLRLRVRRVSRFPLRYLGRWALSVYTRAWSKVNILHQSHIPSASSPLGP
ncbi:hypothetical protein PHBOTO_002942 [Pseudozyma hubeiensis]|nr:hypothetical protein PHBOTO_002942 [Pseudozyma hubeiensis]